MKSKYKLIAVIVVLIGIAYWFVFELMIPFAAKANIPYRWQNIPLGQKRIVVHEYLGSPRINGAQLKGDQWSKDIKANKIFINVGYNSDTVASNCRIGFVYNYWFGKRIYYLKQDSI